MGISFDEGQSMTSLVRDRLPVLSPISSDPLLLVGGMSRSGTTLLTAVLDAHPDLSIGTELIPGQIDAPDRLLEKLDAGLEAASGDFPGVGRALRRDGDYPVGVFFARCARAGVTLENVRRVLEDLSDQMGSGVSSWRERLTLAWAMMRTRWERDQTEMFGFKLNSGAIEATGKLFPNARFVCIVRDPYDVVQSQLKNGFNDDPLAVLKGWNATTKAYADYADAHPAHCALVRYEDIVRAPQRTLKRAFECLPVDFDSSIVAFEQSDAAVLQTKKANRHPNLSNLQKGFFLDSLGKGRRDLPEDVCKLVAESTRDLSVTLGYEGPGYARSLPRKGLRFFRRDSGTMSFGRVLLEKKRSDLRRRRTYEIDRYGELLSPYLSTHKVMRLCDFVRQREFDETPILIVRHDVDHDIENAVRIARWEKAHGVQSTYCILHTAWYYGVREGDMYKHSDLVVRCVQELLDLGHEINFHNNLLVLELSEGINPLRMLENELAFWDRQGVPIIGSSMHGDRLCRELSFRNSELFEECIEERFGGARSITYTPEESDESRTTQVGQASMFDFGLEYEAYDIARDVYHTDSGGKLRTRENTRGRRTFGHDSRCGEVVGVLTHPIWWDLGTDWD